VKEHITRTNVDITINIDPWTYEILKTMSLRSGGNGYPARIIERMIKNELYKHCKTKKIKADE
jgi:hypothetical protein